MENELNDIEIEDINSGEDILDDNIELDLEEIHLANQKLENTLELEQKTEEIAALKEQYKEDLELNTDNKEDDAPNIVLDLNIVDENDCDNTDIKFENLQNTNKPAENTSSDKEVSDLDSFFSEIDDNKQDLQKEEIKEQFFEPVEEKSILDNFESSVSSDTVKNDVEPIKQDFAPAPVTLDLDNEPEPMKVTIEQNDNEKEPAGEISQEKTKEKVVKEAPVISISAEPPVKNKKTINEKTSTMRSHVGHPSGKPVKLIPVSRRYFEDRVGALEEKLTDLAINTNAEIGKELVKIDSQVDDLHKIISNLPTKELLSKVSSSGVSLEDFKEQLTLQLVQLFEGISLTEDFEELKSYIDEKFSNNFSNNELIEKVATNKSILEELSENSKTLPETIREIISDELLQLVGRPALPDNQEEETETPQNEIKTEPEENEESYTFVDIESDFAKTRGVLNEIETSIKDFSTSADGITKFIERIDTLAEDLSSISKRTNKLILTSEDSHKTIKNYLEDFEKTVSELKQASDTLNAYPQQVFNIGSRIDNLNQTLMNTNNSNKAINNALIYMAQWIDSASQSFEYIKREVACIKNEKFTQNTAKINSLEERIQQLDATMNEYTRSNKELKNMLELLLEQTNSNVSTMKKALSIEDKLDLLEHRMSKFEKSINKITSYIEE